MTETNKSDADIVSQVEETAHEVMRRLELLAGRTTRGEFTHRQYVVLSLIEANQPINLSHLGQLLGSAQSSTTEIVARMADGDLVVKKRGPHDGRVVMVRLTDKGRQEMVKRRKQLRDALGSALSKLTQDDRKRLEVDLEKLVGVLRSEMTR